MKKQILFLTVLISMSFFIISCGGNESSENETTQEENTENIENIEQGDDSEHNDVDLTPGDNTKYSEEKIEAVFEHANCFEGECEFSFRTADKELITFYKNYIQPDGYEIEYDLFDNEELQANKKWLGKTFTINYKKFEKYNIITKIVVK